MKGRFLVAGGKLRDTNFFRTVVLLVEHTSEGAMGVVINRPSSLSLANALTGELDLDGCDDALYSGGPVEPGDLFLLHANDSFAEDSHEVCEGVYVTSSAEVLSRVLESDRNGTSSRVVSGYAGWAGGQLEAELSGGDWLTCEATVSDVFESDPYELWDELKARVTRKHHLVSQDGVPPEWN